MSDRTDSRTRVLIALTTEEVEMVTDALQTDATITEMQPGPNAPRAASLRRLADTIEAQMRGRDDRDS